MEAGKYAEADRQHSRLASCMEWFGGGLTTVHRAAIVKASMEYVGLHGGPLRPPFRSMSAGEKEALFSVLDQLGVKKMAGG